MSKAAHACGRRTINDNQAHHEPMREWEPPIWLAIIICLCLSALMGLAMFAMAGDWWIGLLRQAQSMHSAWRILAGMGWLFATALSACIIYLLTGCCMVICMRAWRKNPRLRTTFKILGAALAMITAAVWPTFLYALSAITCLAVLRGLKSLTGDNTNGPAR
jgi:hypothetical protein